VVVEEELQLQLVAQQVRRRLAGQLVVDGAAEAVGLVVKM
jgi:hypothetical protein